MASKTVRPLALTDERDDLWSGGSILFREGWDREARLLWQWVTQHVALSIALATALPMLLGGLTMLSFLLPLRFIPDFELASIVGQLWVAALLGVVQITWLGGVLLVPTIWGRGLLKGFACSGRRYIFVYAVGGTAIALAAIMLAVKAKYSQWYVWGGYVALCGLFALGGAAWKGRSADETDTLRRRVLSLLAWTVIQFVIVLMSMSLISAGHSEHMALMTNQQHWLTLGIVCFAVALVNTGLVLARKLRFLWMLFLGTILIAVLAILTGDSVYLNGLSARRLKLGDVPNVMLTVNESAKSVIMMACSRNNAPPSCTPLPADATNNGATFDGVTILSRIGSQYYLQFCKRKHSNLSCSQEEGIHVVINKADAPGWSVSAATNAVIAGSGQ